MSRCLGFLLIHVWDVFKTFLLVFHFLLKEFRMTQMKRHNCDCVCLDVAQASSCAVATATCLTCGRRNYVIWCLDYLWIHLLVQIKYCSSMHFLLSLDSKFGSAVEDTRQCTWWTSPFAVWSFTHMKSIDIFSRNKVSKSKLEFFLIIKWFRLNQKIIVTWSRVLFWVFGFLWLSFHSNWNADALKYIHNYLFALRQKYNFFSLWQPQANFKCNYMFGFSNFSS